MGSQKKQGVNSRCIIPERVCDCGLSLLHDFLVILVGGVVKTSSTPEQTKHQKREKKEMSYARVEATSEVVVLPLEIDKEKEEDVSVFWETIRFIKISLPNSMVMCFMYLQTTMTLSTVATNLGTVEMSGISLASLTANLTALTIFYGLLTAVDILAPQSFGAGNFQEVGMLVMRGVICVSCTLPFTAMVWLHAEPILLLFGQPPTESHFAGVFLSIHLFSVPALLAFESSRRFLWTQEVSQWPFVIITLVALALHASMLAWLVPTEGFSGAAVAHVITNWTLAILAVGWIACCKPHHAGTADKMFQCSGICGDWKSMRLFVSLALPGVLTMSEWVFFEAFIALSGLLGQHELAASSIAYNLIPIMFTVPSGVAIATTARIGALLAQGNVPKAKTLAKAVFALTLCCTATVITLVYAFEDRIISLFSTTNDLEVRALAHSVWPMVCGFLILDCTFGIQSGLLRALGLQLEFSCIVLVMLFLVGLPLTIVLAFPFGVGLGIVGMWIALPISYVLLNSTLFVAHYRRDWYEYSREVIARESELKQRNLSQV